MTKKLRFLYLSMLTVFSLLLLPVIVGCTNSSHYRLYSGSPRAAKDVAVIEVPHYIQLREWDGITVKRTGAFLGGSSSAYTCLPDRHDLSVRYHEIWPIEPDDHETVISGEVSLEINVEAGRVYRLDINRPDTVKSARQFAADPEFHLSITDRSTMSVMDVTEASPAVKRAQAPSRKNHVEAEAVAVSDPSDDHNQATLKDLQKSWRKASDEERKAFRKWIVDH
jgi:uncharacterized protein YccT (UPF0319 family)